MIILITFILSLSMPTYSRSPAVEPVTGLDIEKYQQADKSAQKFDKASYNWGDQGAQKRISHPSEGLLKNNSNDLIYNYLLTALIFIIPFALWPIIKKKITTSEAKEKRRNEDDSSLARIHDRRKASSESGRDDDDDQLPKAS